MLPKIYRLLLRTTSKPGEKGEYSGGYLQDRVRQEALRLCRGAKGRVLEVGCGEGFFLAQLATQNSGLEMWGIDDDESRLEAASNRLQNANLSSQDAAKLSFEDGYFDIAVCINVLFNMKSIEYVKETLAEMVRVCKKSGSIIFDFRNSMNPLLCIKYKFAKYYDDTVKELPLRTYSLSEIEQILNGLNMKITAKRFIGLRSRFLAAAVIIEAKKIC